MKPELSHRLMNLCQTIFQHEPSKFGWTLFGRAAASSIGFPAIYKLIRWDDQDTVDYSYGLPQLACYLAKAGHLNAPRAAVLLTVCKDHGWHEWQIGKGLHDVISSADSKDRAAIFSLVTSKLDQEHSSGGWEGLWESLLSCVDDFDEINEKGLRDHFQVLRDAARYRRDIENARLNRNGSTNEDYGNGSIGRKWQEHVRDDALATIVAKCELTSASSLDEAIQNVEASDGLAFDNRKRLLEALRESCPYENRVKFLESLCESAELEFDSALELIMECIENWGSSSANVKRSIPDLIKKLFAFKGSELFELRYSGISRQIYRLSKLCGDPKFVLQTVLETVATERLELGGDEWLQLATSLSSHTDPSAALRAFEDLLSSSAANIGDEVGEGAYRATFAAKSDQGDVIADIIWHLLGDSDAFVRWSAARSLKGLLDVGLIEDVGRLLDRFDSANNPSLSSEGHHFSVLNAQQWLLMGLARATLHHGEKLEPLKVRIEELAMRPDLHVLNKLHLARCLKNMEGGSTSSEVAELWAEVQTPLHGIVERDGWPENRERRFDFGFDYEFDKYKVSDLGELFWISKNEANDLIAEEVMKRWPHARNMSDFSGKYQYREEGRFESYRGHIQRHARLWAATKLAKTMPVARSGHDGGLNPWQEFIEREDISFENGSWLSDHKDPVPAQAREFLLGERKESKETLVEKGALFRKVGFSEGLEDRFLPLYGSWTSPDGVHVSLVSALVAGRDPVRQCIAFGKTPDHDFWLPRFESNGKKDRYSKKAQFEPLIWEPEKYPVGIDEQDEWATRGAIARPKLGLALNGLLGLAADEDERYWHNRKGVLALKSEVWGGWKPDHDSQRSTYQDEGAILWADRGWLDETLESCKRSVVIKLSFSKYKSSKSYDDSSGVRERYAGLKRKGEAARFWLAKRTSKTVY